MSNNSQTTKLLNCIKQLSDTAINMLLEKALTMLDVENLEITQCPYCGSKHIVRNGKKCGKQRFLCRGCKQTFVTTTHTVMSMSHFPASVWKEVIAGTLHGDAIDYTAKNLGLSHPCVFGMRHKVLLALQDIISDDPVILSEVSEFDETFVLECYKGKKLPAEVARPARKHGAKAQKRGISSEYVCINTGVQRNGGAVAESVNRAKPDGTELQEVYDGHLADGTLVLCDGLRSYNALKEIADCTITDINSVDAGGSFYHLNTLNNFHSFIKERYNFYRGVATKYLNRYNALFSLAWCQKEDLVESLCSKMLCPGAKDYYHSIREIKTRKLLAI